ncbi:MAG: universal stress protein [Stellaceae bacterium]
MAGVVCEIVHVEHEHLYKAIIDTAASKGCDPIVMASHGRHGISATVLGSETVKGTHALQDLGAGSSLSRPLHLLLLRLRRGRGQTRLRSFGTSNSHEPVIRDPRP